MTSEKHLGIYIHIPFCTSRCTYCDFVSSIYSCDRVANYVRSLKNEILSFAKSDLNKQYVVDTVYFGGGTPSIILEQYIFEILDLIKNNFHTNFSEITIECNPNSISLDKLEMYKKSGINRISFGCQTLNDKSLKAIGRAHDKKQAIESVKLALNCGFNVSCDLMLGIPYQTKDDIVEFIDTFTTLGVKHISTYMLKVEAGTCLEKQINNNEIKILDEDDAQDLFDLTYDLLTHKNYLRYEVSNFALGGYESMHNLKYWNCLDYIGFGVAAHSLINNVRFYNDSDIDSYISKYSSDVLFDLSNYSIEAYLNRKDLINERIMLNFRTINGIDLIAFKKDFDMDFLKIYSKQINMYKDYLIIKNGFISIKPQYLSILNSIVIDFLD